MDPQDTKPDPQTSLVKAPEKSLEGPRPWRWSRKKRRAAQMLFGGSSRNVVAKDVGVHRHTIANWLDVGEFRHYMSLLAQEHVETKRYRRVRETGAIADQLMGVVAKQLRELDSDQRRIKSGKKAGKLRKIDHGELNLLQTALREYREFRGQERTDFGDDARRGEMNLNVSFARQSMPGAGAGPGKVGAQSFAQFIGQNMEQIDQKSLAKASKEPNPLGALTHMTRSLLTNTDVLDSLHREEADNERTR